MAAKKKEPIPKWFSPHGKPDVRWIRIPQKTLQPTTEISREQINEGEVLNLKSEGKNKSQHFRENYFG